MAQVSPIRTPEELKNPEFNYFIAFKVELHETDKTKIEAKIKTVTSDPKGGVLSRRLLELKNDAIEIMCNDSIYDSGSYRQAAGGRKQEAENAKAFKLKEAVGIIEILCQTRKTLLKSEIIDILNTANKPVVYFSEEEFFSKLSYLNGLGVKIIDNIDTQIPFSDYQQAEKQLKAIDKRDLYDFLGVTSTASNSEITSASDALYKSSSKTNDLKKKQSISTLCGTVKKLLLSTPQARKNYDNYLVLKDDVWSDFEKRKGFGIKEMTMDEYKDYTQKVIDLLKTTIDDAEKILAIGCKYYQLTIVGKTDGNNLEYCPYDDCGKLYIKGAKSCPHCGKPLEIICWNCKQKTPFTKDDKGCPTCGATHHAHDIFLKKCAALDALTNKPEVEIAELQSAFLEIKNVVPNYATRTDSTVFVKVQEYDKVLQAKIKQEETTGAKYKDDIVKINDFIGQKKYQAAFNIAKSLQVKYGNYNITNTQKVVSQITAVINSANSHLASAKQYVSQGNERLAVSEAVKAIDICDDHTEARQILQKYPPKAVANLRATLSGNVIRLEWDDNSQQDFTTYTIIKKVGIAPVNAEDGALVDRGLSIKFFEDENVVPATPYFYSVYAERYGVKSNICSTSSAVTVYSDVSNVQQDFVTEGIKVIWDTPQNIKDIEVWKNTGAVAPLKAGEGTRVDCDTKGFHDAKCEGDNAYLITCTYQTKSGTIKSKGVRVVYKPYERTVPLENVAIESIGSNRYVFTCDGGYAGKVSLYYSNTKLPVQTNTVLKYIDFNSICKGMTRINATTNADGQLSFSLPQNKICQVYPIVATEQLFVISPPHLINTMSGMSCTHTVTSGTVSICGSMHPKANCIVVKVSNSKYAEKLSDNGENFTFKKEELLKKGKIEIKLKSNSINYISIFVEFIEDGVKSYSQPVKLDPPIDYREAVAVLYSLDYNVSAVKPFKVTIAFESEKDVEIPALLLMKGHPRPMNKNAGELCERLEPLKLKKGLFSKKYSGKHVVTVSPTALNTKFAVFSNSDKTFVQLKEVKKI